MAFNKKRLFEKADQMASYYADAISHPARLSMIRQLYYYGPCTVEQLNAVCPLAQPTVSQHLEVLREVELVQFREKCPYTYYRIHGKNLLAAESALLGFFRELREHGCVGEDGEWEEKRGG
jgi:DNA-binding transcriptional ArsR family regulator